MGYILDKIVQYLLIKVKEIIFRIEMIMSMAKLVKRAHKLSLKHIANKLRAHKPDHYLDLYHSLFRSKRNEPINMLEIGIGKGGSLKAWQLYFPNASIFAMDINDCTDIVPKEVEWHQGDQSNMLDLSVFMDRKYDLIIDDGSHIDWDMQFTLGVLFSLLKPGGIYSLEDLDCRRPNKNNCPSTRKMLRHFKETGEVISPAITPEQSEYVANNIEKCKIQLRLAILHKSN